MEQVAQDHQRRCRRLDQHVGDHLQCRHRRPAWNGDPATTERRLFAEVKIGNQKHVMVVPKQPALRERAKAKTIDLNDYLSELDTDTGVGRSLDAGTLLADSS